MKKISALPLCAALLPARHNGYDKKDGKVYFHTARMSDNYYKVELEGVDAKTF